MRLLLVEDDPKIAKFLEDGLSQNGYAVDLASDGELALDLLNLNSYDLLICDVMLQKVDGLSIVK